MSPVVLVLVHPGSACGSADFNIGRFEARAARDQLAWELKTWSGGIVVIDGALSDELDSYPFFAQSISDCLARSKAGGHLSVRVMGSDDDDLDQVERIREVAEAMGQAAMQTEFIVTGAWYHPEDGGGCVGSVIEELRRMGLKASVADSAVHLTLGDEAEDEEEKGEGDDIRLRDADDDSSAAAAPQPAAIGSEAFLRWFQDSKVVDESGEPMVVYHGTSARFTTFDASRQGQTAGVGGGFFFVSRKEVAKEVYGWRKGGRVMGLYLSLQNPLGFDEYFARTGKDRLVETSDSRDAPVNYFDNNADEIVAFAKNNGYDGIMWPADQDSSLPHDLIVAFHAEQIKSATHNDGSFDPHSTDIRRKDEAAAAMPPMSDPDDRWMRFRRWFKDSKVVAPDGTPLVVFHGTNKDFSEFDTDRELGSHFGTAEQASRVASFWEAKGKAGTRLIPVHLSIQNPLRLVDHGIFNRSVVGQQLVAMGLLTEVPKTMAAVKQAIIDAGYDGVVYANTREGAGDSYVAFRPEQIKSALANAGWFDPASADIRSRVGEQEAATTTTTTIRRRHEQEAHHLVETAAFKQWFGKSKVVDAQGRPLIQYHGTFADFNKFELSESFDGAFHFGTAAAANARNAYWLDGADMAVAKPNVMPVYLCVENPKRLDFDPLYEDEWAPIIAQAQAEGHDGIVYPNDVEGGESWAVWRPEQVKSATGNAGTFDPASPDIRLRGDDRSVQEASRPAVERTPSFRSWFNDSKVVDQQGLPLVVFHGSYRFEGSAFSYDAKGINDYGDADIGFFFGSAEVANEFAGSADEQGTEAVLLPVYLRIINPKIVQGADFVKMLDSFRFADWKRFKREALKSGHDGIIVRTDAEAQASLYHQQFQSDNYVAFEPAQIKSALGNRGTFDPSLADILMRDAEQVVAERSEADRQGAFDRWFGGSKVTDGQGRARVVFHGTRRDFSSFGAAFPPPNKNTDNPTNRMGFFFTEDADDAARWAGRRAGAEHGQNIMPVFLNIRRPRLVSAKRFGHFLRSARQQTIDNFVQESVEKGYDGFKIAYQRAEDLGGVHEPERTWWVAFDSAQIKSATGNLGTFDATNPDLRFRERDAEDLLPWSRDEVNVFFRDATRVEYAVYEKHLDIIELYTVPSGRNRGSARAALTALLVKADREGLAVRLMVLDATGHSDEQRLQDFYESFGFVVYDHDDGAPLMLRAPAEGLRDDDEEEELNEPGGGRHPTESQQFAAWFNDSKIVDREGKPLVVYHGTTRDFSEFQSTSPRTVYRLDGVEVERADSWDMGDDRAGKPDAFHYMVMGDVQTLGAARALEVRRNEAYRLGGDELSPESARLLRDLERMQGKTLVITTEPRPTGDGFYFTPHKSYSFIRDIAGPGSNVMPVYLSIRNPIYLNAAQIESAGLAFRMEQYRAQGYDGAIYTEHPQDLERYNGFGGATQIVAFEPTQVKSALGNVGAFDRSNPDIRFSDGPRLAERFDEHVFHVTPRSSVRSIVEDGLRPQIGPRAASIGEQEPRVYFFTSVQALEDGLVNWLGEQFGEDEQLALLAVRKSDVPDLVVTAGAEYEATGSGTIAGEKVHVVALDVDQVADLGAAAAPESSRRRRGTTPFSEIGSVRSAAFSEWFGDSQVLDTNANPQVLFHGTDADLTEMHGGWMTDDPRVAREFGSTIYPVYARIEKPAYDEDLQQQYEQQAGHPFDEEAEGVALRDMAASGGPFTRHLIAQGFDGIITWDDSNRIEAYAYVVFDPSQVKSAIGNVGTFERAIADMRHRDADTDAIDSAPIYREMAADEELIEAIEWWIVECREPPAHLNEKLLKYARRLPEVRTASAGGFMRDFQRAQPEGVKPHARGWSSWTTHGEAIIKHFRDPGFEVLTRSSARGIELGQVGLWRTRLTQKYHEYGGQGEWLLLNESVFPELRMRDAEPQAASAPKATSAFERWFAGSRVVDDEGRPLRVFHGTQSAGFSAFETPAYFTALPGEASMYSTDESQLFHRWKGLRTAEAFEVSQVEDGISFADRDWWEADKWYVVGDGVFRKRADGCLELSTHACVTFDFAQGRFREDALLPPQTPGTYAVYLSIKNPAYLDAASAARLAGPGNQRGKVNRQVVDGLMAQGYDGVIADSDWTLGKHYIAFHASQIKSAISNVAFDPANPDIRLRDEIASTPSRMDALSEAGRERLLDAYRRTVDRDRSTPGFRAAATRAERRLSKEIRQQLPDLTVAEEIAVRTALRDAVEGRKDWAAEYLANEEVVQETVTASSDPLAFPVYEQGALGEGGLYRSASVQAKEQVFRERGLVEVAAGGWGMIWVRKDEAAFIATTGFGGSHLNGYALHALQLARAGRDLSAFQVGLVEELVQNMDMDAAQAEAVRDGLVAQVQAAVARAAPLSPDEDFDRWIAGSRVKTLVYHGTSEEFAEFRTPAWFSTARENAEEVASARGGGRIVEAYLAIRRPYYGSLKELQQFTPRWAAQKEAEGYDGAIFDFAPLKEQSVVAFRPDQIKVVNSSVMDLDNDDNSMDGIDAPATASREFQQWFGASVARDAEGKPLVVYHGSQDARFTQEGGDGIFKTLRQRYDVDDPNAAFFFTSDERVAQTYMEGKRAFDRDAEPGVVRAYLSLVNPLVIDNEGRSWKGTRDAVQAARAGGHDGLVIRNVVDDYNTTKVSGPTDVYVVFDPAQIKSVDAAAFDPNSSDLRMRDGESATEDAGSELTYNKRNRQRGGLTWADIADKDAALRVREVRKDKIYPKPDYVELCTRVAHPIIAHLVKQCYDAIANEPATRNAPTDEELQFYIQQVNHYMEGVIAWATHPSHPLEFLKKQANSASVMLGAMKGTPTNLMDLAPAAYKTLLESVYVGGVRQNGAAIRILGNAKPAYALQPGLDDVKRAMKDIELGWPAKLEAWQKRGFRIVKGDDLIGALMESTGGVRKLVTFGMISLKSAGNPNVETKLFEGKHKSDPEPQQWVQERLAELRGKYLLTSKHYRLQSTHPTEEAAKAAARELTKRDGGKGIDDKGISVEAADRTGPAHRADGEDITSERLMTTFGFKGVNFGNWMKGKANEAERQLHLNHAFDSLMDLAEILDVPPQAMSLNGMLGLAIGAQGNGGMTAAHFVPGVNEINITRTSGAGSLGHEYGHALDHFAARLAGLERVADPFLMDHVDQPAEVMRTVLVEGKHQSVRVSRFADSMPAGLVDRFRAVHQAMNHRPITDEELAKRRDESKARSDRNIRGWLASFRSDFERYPATLPEFDKLAARVSSGDYGELKPGKNFESMYEVIDSMRKLYKTASGRIYSMDQAKSLQSNLAFRASFEEAPKKSEVVPARPIMVATSYAAEALKLDKDKGGKLYWSTDHEKFARAFDAFITDELAARGRRNTYLSHADRLDETTPQGEERERIRAAIKDLLALKFTYAPLANAADSPTFVEGSELRRRDAPVALPDWAAESAVVDQAGHPQRVVAVAGEEGLTFQPASDAEGGVYLNIRNAWSWVDYPESVPAHGRIDQSVEALKARGFDGIHRASDDRWQAFDASQVFDPSRPPQQPQVMASERDDGRIADTPRGNEASVAGHER